MRIATALRLLMLAAMACTLQACLGTGGPSSATQPLPLLASSPDSPTPDGNTGLSPEEARAQAIADIRAKAQAHHVRQDAAPYPGVFVTHGPPLAISSPLRPQAAIEAELAGVRSDLEGADDPEEVAALEERMAELMELGRTHAQQSEQQIQANSERMK